MWLQSREIILKFIHKRNIFFELLVLYSFELFLISFVQGSEYFRIKILFLSLQAHTNALFRQRLKLIYFTDMLNHFLL